MKTIQINLYEFNELEEKAKQKALDECRDLNVSFDWWDFNYDDFISICTYFGISVDKESIYFSGFYSQGDGSKFNADVDLPKLIDGVDHQAWREYAPKLDFDFPALTVDKRVLQLIRSEKIDINARILGSIRYYNIVVDLGLPSAFHPFRSYDLIYGELDKVENWLDGIAKVLNRFLYKSLKSNYEYETDDKTVAETIEANEYLFTKDGRKASQIEHLAVAD